MPADRLYSSGYGGDTARTGVANFRGGGSVEQGGYDYGGGEGIDSRRPEEPGYGSALGDIRAQQLASAEELYTGASDASNMAANQQRYDALTQGFGAIGSGDPMAGRIGTMAAAQGSGAAGAQGLAMGSRDRLQAADVYMTAQQVEAQQEQAMMDQYIQRLAAHKQMSDRIAGAQQGRNAADAAYVNSFAGGMATMGGTALASGANSGGGTQGSYRTGGGY